MDLASIMVHVSGGATSNKRVTVARKLAEAWNAKLIGLAGSTVRLTASGDFAVGSGSEDSGGDITELEDPTQIDTAPISAWLADLEAEFRATVGSHVPIEWRSAIEQPTGYLIAESRAADLVVLGTARQAADSERFVDPASVLMQCGRPVLIVPEAVETPVGRDIVIGWKEAREARRAVRDALPFLRRAASVKIVQVNEPDGHPASNPIADVAEYLNGHEVPVRATLAIPPKGHPAATLIEFARSEGADLIVAGGYGHSRLGEWIFGGVTRDLMASDLLCCMLSH